MLNLTFNKKEKFLKISIQVFIWLREKKCTESLKGFEMKCLA